jgi:RNA polymerase sigma factor (TIGR02999 family)
MSDVTRILWAIEQGEPQAAEQLLPLVYKELRRLAKSKMFREAAGQTLQPTALVHEAYLRLVKPDPSRKWHGSGHFFVAAAESMRRLLIENARRKNRRRHGGGQRRRGLNPDIIPAPESDAELLALDAAMSRFAGVHPVKARLVELRYFGGLTGDQAAEALGISPSTADRYWVFARAWLRRELETEPTSHES